MARLFESSCRTAYLTNTYTFRALTFDLAEDVAWQYRVTAVNRKVGGKGSDVVAVPRMTAEGAD